MLWRIGSGVGEKGGRGRGSVAAYDGGRPIQDAARLCLSRVRDGFRRGLPWIRGGATVDRENGKALVVGLSWQLVN